MAVSISRSVSSRPKNPFGYQGRNERTDHQAGEDGLALGRNHAIFYFLEDLP
jgi:hypothetical protein